MTMHPSQLYLPTKDQWIDRNMQGLSQVAWIFLQEIQNSLTSIDLTSQVTGVLPGANGGTNHSNTGRTLTITGADLTLTQTGTSNVTMPTSGTLAAQNAPITATPLTVNSGVGNDGSGLKHKRVSTGSIGGGSSALVTVSWATPFADANYTPVASVLDGTASSSALSVVHIESVLAGSIAVRVQNTSGGALTGTIFAHAMHD